MNSCVENSENTDTHRCITKGKSKRRNTAHPAVTWQHAVRVLAWGLFRLSGPTASFHDARGSAAEGVGSVKSSPAARDSCVALGK